MSRRRTRLARVGLLLLAGLSVVLGVLILGWPEVFYSWGWVNMGMPYNPHLLLDYGAMNMAMAVVLSGAAVSSSPAFMRTALAAYATWAVLHFLIHLGYRSHFAAHASPTEANLLISVLGVGAVIPLVLLCVSLRADGTDQD